MTIKHRFLFFWDGFTVSRARRWQVTYPNGGGTTRPLSAVEAEALKAVFGGVIHRATPEEGTQA